MWKGSNSSWICKSLCRIIIYSRIATVLKSSMQFEHRNMGCGVNSKAQKFIAHTDSPVECFCKQVSSFPRCSTQIFFFPHLLINLGVISCACDHHTVLSYLPCFTSSALLATPAPSHDLPLTTGGTNGNLWHSNIGIKCTDWTGCLHQSEWMPYNCLFLGRSSNLVF